MTVKSSSEYGWLSITAAEYHKMERHGYAGRETDSDTVWVLAQDETGATCLWKGVTLSA